MQIEEKNCIFANHSQKVFFSTHERKTYTMNTLKIRTAALLRVFAFLGALLAVSACSNSTGHDHDHSDHVELGGARFRLSGAQVASVINGTVTGSFSVAAGDMTGLITTEFVDVGGAVADLSNKSAYSVEWEISDTTKAVIERHTGDGFGRFHIKGKVAGSTTIRVKVKHEDHFDFVSAWIPVAVTAANGAEEIVGLVVKDEDGKEILRFFNNTLTGSVSFSGAESAEMRVWGLDAQGREVTPDEHHELHVHIKDTLLAEVEKHDGEPWNFSIKALKKGTSTIEIWIEEEGDDDHGDDHGDDHSHKVVEVDAVLTID